MALTGLNQNPYVIEMPQPEQQQQGGINPMMMQQFMPQAGGAATGATGTGAGGAGAGVGAATGTTGAGAAGTGSGASSGLAAAGPWAALAAVIIGNEYGATEAGRRTEGTQYAKDLLGGKVISQDAPYYADKAFGDDEFGLGGDAVAGSELLSLDFSNAWDALKGGSVGKLLGKIF